MGNSNNNMICNGPRLRSNLNSLHGKVLLIRKVVSKSVRCGCEWVRWNGLPWNTFLFIYVFLPQPISFVTFSTTTTTSQNANAAKIAAKLFRWIIATNFASCCAAFDSLCNSGNNFTLLFMQSVSECEWPTAREREIKTRERRESSLNWHACLFWFAAALSNWMSMETGSENWMHNNNNASELSEARRGEFARSFVRLEVATQTETINSNWRLSKPALQAARQQRERAESEAQPKRGVRRERCIERAWWWRRDVSQVQAKGGAI